MNDEQVRHDSDSEEELGSDASWESFGQGADSDNSWRSRSNSRSRSRSRSRSGSTSGSRRSNLSSEEEEVHVDAGGDRPRRRRGRGLGRDQNPVQGPNLFEWEVYDEFSPDPDQDWLPTGLFSDIDRPRRGVLVDTHDFTPIDYFFLFFPPACFEHIVQETNRYAYQDLFDKADDSYAKRLWRETDRDEIMAFIGLRIAMGLCSQPSQRENWSTWWLTESNFTKVMSRDRSTLVGRYFHFSNNEHRIERGQPNYNLLQKIQPIIDLTQNTYADCYKPSRHLSIDEAVIPFKGRTYVKQYLRDKPHKWGIKVFVLADSSCNFLLKYRIYTGKADFVVDRGRSFGEQIVEQLMTNYLNKGHILYLDNFYTAPKLAYSMMVSQTGVIGTVKENRKDFPVNLKKSKKRMKKQDPPAFMSSGNMVCVTWHDSKRVSLISTVDTNNTCDKRVRAKGEPTGYRLVEKPVIAERYNNYMGGVDHFNQLSMSYRYPYRNYKWYMAVFNFIVETALVNGYTLYTLYSKSSDPPAKVEGAVYFRRKIVDALVRANTQRRQNRHDRPAPNLPVGNRLSSAAANHFPDKFADPKHKPRCHVCSQTFNKRKQTTFFCPGCTNQPPLCVYPCFRLYHTQELYGAARRQYPQ